jgi:hypothetical protein
VIDIANRVKQTYCQYCEQILIPGYNCRVRLRVRIPGKISKQTPPKIKNKKKQKVQTTYCFRCKEHCSTAGSSSKRLKILEKQAIEPEPQKSVNRLNLKGASSPAPDQKANLKSNSVNIVTSHKQKNQLNKPGLGNKPQLQNSKPQILNQSGNNSKKSKQRNSLKALLAKQSKVNDGPTHSLSDFLKSI